MKRLAGSACLFLVLAGPARAQEPLKITVSAGKKGYNQVPVCVPLSLPASWEKNTLAELRGPNLRIPAQLTSPGIRTQNVTLGKGVRRDLHFILAKLSPGQTLTLTLHPLDRSSAEHFSWKDHKGSFAELDFGPDSRPSLRYMYQAYDDSTPENRDRTYKVFHHLYDPDGKRLVTNGGQTDLKRGEKRKLLYPHHRGLMYGFNRVSYGKGQQADTWHCTKGAHLSHVKFLKVEAGPVLGRHRVLIDWYGQKNDVFANEERELTVYHLPGGTLVEFASRLVSTGGPVKLDGDPQHAGFQFRASQDVADKTSKETYYLRPDGKGEPEETRNWDPKTKKGPVNLPWDAMSFVLDGQRFTAAYLNHPDNPGESRWSERDYGRFGCYFAFDCDKDRPLVVRYRLWLQKGEMTVAGVQDLSEGFIHPPTVR